MHKLIRKCKNSSLILIFVILANSLPVGSADKPQARVSNPDWDFGYVPQKSKVKGTFYLRNSGTSPLNVSRIKSGCSCTSNSKIEKPIPPGDSAAITITFNSGRYHSMVRKTTTVFTDDPDSSVQILNIAAVVYKNNETTGDISVNPQKITIKINEEGLIAEADSLEISNNGSDSVAVNILHTSKTVINQIDIPRAINPDGKIRPKLHLTDEPLADEINGESIIFGFIGRDTTIITIPIEIKK